MIFHTENNVEIATSINKHVFASAKIEMRVHFADHALL